MAFKRKTDTGSGEQFKFENKGDTLTGWFLGSLPHEGDYGPTKKHLFKTEKGIKVVFGQTHLTQLLEGESTGQLMRVTLDGAKKMKKGNPMKMYTLDIDPEQCLDAAEVSDSVDESENPVEDSDNDEPAEDTEEPADEVKTAPAKAAPKASPPSAARQAKVQSLLAGRKSA